MRFHLNHTCQSIPWRFPGNLRRRIFLGWLVLEALTMAWAGEGDVPLSIVIKAESEVTGERIFLGDLVDEKAGASFGDLWTRLDISASPRPGMVKTIVGRKLIKTIRTAPGFPEGARVVAPETVRVRRACQHVPEERIKELLSAGIGQGDAVIRRLTVRGNSDFPMGALSIRLSEQKTDKKMRRLDATLEVTVDGKTAGQLNASALIDRYAEVVFLARGVSPGEVLKAADLCLKRVNISMTSNHLLFSMDEAIGKQAKQGLRLGACLNRNQLANPILVQKGDQVKLIVKNGPLSIATTGTAKSSGGVSEQIRVENMASNRIVVGHVVDASTVEIVF